MVTREMSTNVKPSAWQGPADCDACGPTVSNKWFTDITTGQKFCGACARDAAKVDRMIGKIEGVRHPRLLEVFHGNIPNN